jgi:O-antigen ligase
MKEKILTLCAKADYIAIILIPFAASFSSALVNSLVGVLVFTLILKLILRKKFFLFGAPLNLMFLLLFAVSLFSFVNSVSIKASLGGLEKILKYSLLYSAVLFGLADARHAKRAAIAIILGLFLASFDAIFQLSWGKDLFRGRPYDAIIGLARPTAAFPHTNVFAVYLGLFLPVCFALLFYHKKGRGKLFLGLTVGLALFCLIATFSRGAVAGFIFALIMMAIVKKDKLILGIIILSLLLAPFLLPQGIRDWMKNTDSIWEVMLNKERINIYKAAANMIKAHPFLGVGTDTFCLNFQKYKIPEKDGFTGEGQYFAHNNFLHLAGEIGLFGLAVFLWMLWALFRSASGFLKNNDSGFITACGLGLLGGIAAFLINGMTETTLYYSKVSTLFWYQVGLLLGLCKLKKENQDEPG